MQGYHWITCVVHWPTFITVIPAAGHIHTHVHTRNDIHGSVLGIANNIIMINIHMHMGHLYPVAIRRCCSCPMNNRERSQGSGPVGEAAFHC